MCKIGGEVSHCNILGYSNKVHDGFLVHCFIGEWVNIGAGTNNSNLKNNYNNINIMIDNKNIETGLQFLGSLIGDFSRIAIGTLLNTGSYISIGANLINHNFSLKYVSSFSWGDDKIVEIDKFITTKEEKAQALRECLVGKFNPLQYPAQFIFKNYNNDIYILCDQSAAKDLA